MASVLSRDRVSWMHLLMMRVVRSVCSVYFVVTARVLLGRLWMRTRASALLDGEGHSAVKM